MADDERRDEEEFKITVRDRRRVTLSGELREVEPDEAPTPAAPPPPPPAEPPRERPKPRGGALGGAERARVRRGEGHLREVPSDVAEADEQPEARRDDDASGAPRQPRDLYEYTQVLALGMIEWSVAATGLMPNPLTRIVMTDMEQAQFGIEAAEALYDLLVKKGKFAVEARIGFCHSFVLNFGQLAAQLLQQPPQVRLQEMGKVRFCIDVADRFVQRLREIPDDEGLAQVEQIERIVADVRLRFIQLSGGGGIVG